MLPPPFSFLATPRPKTLAAGRLGRPGEGKRLHHPFDDPPKAKGTPEQKMEVCRRVRDEIDGKVKAWIAAESN